MTAVRCAPCRSPSLRSGRVGRLGARQKNPQRCSRRTPMHQARRIWWQLRFKIAPPLNSWFLKQLATSPLNLSTRLQLPLQPHNLIWCRSLENLTLWTPTAKAESILSLIPIEATAVTSARDMGAFLASASTATCPPRTSSLGPTTPYLSSGTATPLQASAARQTRTIKILWTRRPNTQLPVTQHSGESTSSDQLLPWSSSGSLPEPGRRTLHEALLIL